MELVEETARWREEETENEWESLALGPGWALLLRAPGQEEGEAMGLPTGVQSWAASGTLFRAGGWGRTFQRLAYTPSQLGIHRSHRVRRQSFLPTTARPFLCPARLHDTSRTDLRSPNGRYDGRAPAPLCGLTLLPSYGDLRPALTATKTGGLPVHGRARESGKEAPG